MYSQDQVQVLHLGSVVNLVQLCAVRQLALSVYHRAFSASQVVFSRCSSSANFFASSRIFDSSSLYVFLLEVQLLPSLYAQYVIHHEFAELIT